MKEIRVGFGRTDITPDCSVPLAGFGNVSKRMSTGYLDRIYTTCIAISDPQGSTVLLFGSDLCTSSEEAVKTGRLGDQMAVELVIMTIAGRRKVSLERRLDG